MLHTLFLAAFRPPVLDITSLDAGETVRYPLLLIRGTTPDKDVAVGTDWKTAVRFPAAEGKFEAVVELKPGENMILVNSGRDTIRQQVVYQPTKTPYKVRMVYLEASDEGPEYEVLPGGDSSQFRKKLDIALKMMQSVAAESMKEAGYGRKTFPLELGPDGKVVIHVIRTGSTGDELRKLDGNTLWSRFYGELQKPFDYDVDKICAVMAFTRWDRRAKVGRAHTALGGGALGLFGGGTLWSWPASVAEIPTVFSDARPVDDSRVMDDTGLRGTVWASASTAVGAMLHEMGHTFGLPHSTDGRSAMSRGFDFLNRRFVVSEPPRKGSSEGRTVGFEDATHWDPFEAARLNLHPWFQPDGLGHARFPAATPPKIRLEGDEVIVDAPYGLGLVGAVREGKPGVFRKFDGDRSIHLRRSEMGEGEATLIAVDVDGNQTEIKLP